MIPSKYPHVNQPDAVFIYKTIHYVNQSTIPSDSNLIIPSVLRKLKCSSNNCLVLLTFTFYLRQNDSFEIMTEAQQYQNEFCNITLHVIGAIPIMNMDNNFFLIVLHVRLCSDNFGLVAR